MPHTLQDACCASLPAESLGALAGLRRERDIQVAIVGVTAWVRWDQRGPDLAPLLLSIPGAQLFAVEDKRWYHLGESLPFFDFPTTKDFRPLHDVLFPAPISPAPPPPLATEQVALTLVPDDEPRPATAMLCDLAALLHWGEAMPTARLSKLRGAYREDKILVLGQRLPWWPETVRFWGKDLYLPLGFRLEPDLPAGDVRTLLEVGREEMLIWFGHGLEAIPLDLFKPLSRGGLRMAIASRAP